MKHIQFSTMIVAVAMLTACADDNQPVPQQPIYQQAPQVIQQVQPQSEFDGSDALSAAAGAAAGYAMANSANKSNHNYNTGYSRPTVVHKTVIVNNTVVKKSPSYSKSYSYKPSSSYKTTTIRTTKSYSRR